MTNKEVQVRVFSREELDNTRIIEFNRELQAGRWHIVGHVDDGKGIPYALTELDNPTPTMLALKNYPEAENFIKDTEGTLVPYE